MEYLPLILIVAIIGGVVLWRDLHPRNARRSIPTNNNERRAEWAWKYTLITGVTPNNYGWEWTKEKTDGQNR